MSEKKFPKSNLFFAILCAIYISAYIIFYAVYAQRHGGDRIVLASVVTGAFILVVAIVMLVRNVKFCLTFRKYKQVMRFGVDGVCTVFDFKKIKYNEKKWNTKFALVLHYFDNGLEKSYTTGYDFWEAECEYLKELKEVKCRILGDTVVVTEIIPEKIYENLTTYGKIESKFVRIFIKIWSVIAVVSVMIMLAGIMLTIALSDNLFLIIGVICCFGVNLLCGIVYAICFFAGKC